MLDYAEPIVKLIDELKRLPGVGGKSAQRIAFHLLRVDPSQIERLVGAIHEVRDKIVLCSVCNNITDVDPCRYCTSPARDRSVILVVEEPHNLVTVEKTREFRGLFHVLHGSLSPLRGVGPDDIRIRGLLERLRTDEVKEVILATNPNTEGEATANYISRLIRPLGIKVTRIGMGVPVGSDLEYTDEVTMHKSLQNRTEM
jgi:recombination protein RecR